MTSTTTNQTMLIRHGAMVMLLGMIAGFAYGFSLLGEIQLSPLPVVFADSFPGRTDGWRAAHVGNVLNGIMIVAFAAVLARIGFPPARERLVSRALVVTVWGNACFYSFAVFAPNHGLSIGDNRLGAGNVAAVLAYVPAMVAAVAVTIALIAIVVHTTGSANRRE